MSSPLADLQVLRLPQGAVHLATSPTAPFEAWSYSTNVIACQGHPELTTQQAITGSWQYAYEHRKAPHSVLAEAKASFENVPADGAMFLNYIQRACGWVVYQPHVSRRRSYSFAGGSFRRLGAMPITSTAPVENRPPSETGFVRPGKLLVGEVPLKQ